VQQADLDKTTVQSFLEELEEAGEILAVMAKPGPGKANPEPVSLGDGSEQLLAGRLRGLQIRYRQDGEEWCDTLIRTANGYRITRMKRG